MSEVKLTRKTQVMDTICEVLEVNEDHVSVWTLAGAVFDKFGNVSDGEFQSALKSVKEIGLIHDDPEYRTMPNGETKLVSRYRAP